MVILQVPAVMEPKPRSELVDLHLSLLELERKEEKKRRKQLAEDGASALEAVVTKVDTENEVYILTVRLQLPQDRKTPSPPKHNIEQGSQVSVSESELLIKDLEKKEEKTSKDPSAVAIEVAPSHLRLAFLYEPKMWEDKTPSGKTVFLRLMENEDHTQLTEAMKWLKKVNTDRASHPDEPAVPVVREMFQEHHRNTAEQRANVAEADDMSSSLGFFSRKLDKSQRKAVGLALRDQPLTVIHGPPGTGKTTTIVEVILQHVERGQRVLVCAPSNKAVDNTLDGLWKQTKKVVCELNMEKVLRLGHLARMEEKHRRFSPHLKVKKHMERIERLRMPLVKMQHERARMMAGLLRGASVVMSTLTSVRSVEMDEPFDLLVIDECAQATEAACWLAIPYARKVLLAGDHCQLPPTILSQEAARRGLAVSLMERQMELHDEGVVHMLDTQYRMHELIQAWSSKILYDGKLKAAPEVASRLLTQLPGVRKTTRSQPTLLLVDSAGCKLKESQKDKTTSWCHHTVQAAGVSDRKKDARCRSRGGSELGGRLPGPREGGHPAVAGTLQRTSSGGICERPSSS